MFGPSRFFKPLPFLIFTLFTGLFPGALHSHFIIDPLVQEVAVPAGGSFSRTLTITNKATQDLEVSVTSLDWKYLDPSGSKDILPSGSTRYSCSKWITVSPNKFSVAAGKTAQVRFALTAPPSAQGGYVAILVFSAGFPTSPQGQAGMVINMVVQMTSTVVVEIEKTQKVLGRVTAMELVDPKPDRPLDVRARFKNEGNVRINAKGRLAILDEDGSAIGWTQFPDIKTLPGDEWSVTGSWKAGLPKGRYRLVGTFELGPGQVLVEEKAIKIE